MSCKGCRFYRQAGGGRHAVWSCDYILMTGESRKCSPDKCDKRQEKSDKPLENVADRIRFLAPDHEDSWIAKQFGMTVAEVREIIGTTVRTYRITKLERIPENELFSKSAKELTAEYEVSESTVRKARKLYREGGACR